MVIKESEVGEILVKINKAVINPVTMHPFDEERVAHLFNNLFKQNVKYEISDIQVIVNRLDSEYPEYTKKRIFQIAESKLRKASKK